MPACAKILKESKKAGLQDLYIRGVWGPWEVAVEDMGTPCSPLYLVLGVLGSALSPVSSVLSL